jgi:hypothetical protein
MSAPERKGAQAATADEKKAERSDPKKKIEGLEQAIARTGTVGEGSYEATRAYEEGFQEFSEVHSAEESIADADEIDLDDPELARAEKAGKAGLTTKSEEAERQKLEREKQARQREEQGRTSVPSVP